MTSRHSTFDRGQRLQRSAVLLQQGGVAELPSRGSCGFFSGYPLRHESFGQQPQVFPDLRVELVAVTRTAQESTQLRRDLAEPE